MPFLTPIQPEGWVPAKGYSNGMLAPAGARILFVAGQIAWNERQELIGRGDFVAQFEQALKNVRAIVEAAGGTPEHIARLTIYVTDKQLYNARIREVGKVYREVLGRHFPAMALVQVADLLEPEVWVEIEATAALPG